MARTKDKITTNSDGTLDTMRVASGPLEALIDSWDSWTHLTDKPM